MTQEISAELNALVHTLVAHDEVECFKRIDTFCFLNEFTLRSTSMVDGSLQFHLVKDGENYIINVAGERLQ